MRSDQAPFTPTAAAAAVWQARKSLSCTLFAVVPNPLEIFVAREMFKRVPEGATLADLAPTEPGAWLCSVDDEYISRAHWHYMPPQGSIVVFRSLPQGGGGGKASLRIALTLAVMYFTAGLGGSILGINGISALSGLGISASGAVGLANALVTGAAIAAVNALIPLDASNSASSGGGATQYSAQAQANLSRIGEPIPEIFGYDNGWPDLATQPYSTYENNEQFLYLILAVGRGQYKINAVSIGSTSITSFADATIIRAGPDQDVLDGPGTGVLTVLAQTLVDPSMITSPDAVQLEMKSLDYVGPFADCPPERTVVRVYLDIFLPRGLDSGRSVEWRVEYRHINDFDEPTTEWVIQATETYSTASPVPLRLSYLCVMPEGRHQFRLVRRDTRSTDDASAHDLMWGAMRSVLSVGSEVYSTDCTFLCIKIRASGQLNGSLRFRAMTQRMLRTWDGAAWTAPIETRSPAWALARVLEVRGVPDADIDLDQLYALSLVWEERQDRFDYRFDALSTTWDALALIARVGRAVPLIRGSKYTFARDALETTPVALFGMRNIKRGSFSMAVNLPGPEPMKCLDLEYWDHRRWGWVTVTAQAWGQVIYGYRGDANRPEAVGAPSEQARGRIRVPGIIGENHAMRTVVYMMADGLFRRMVATYSTELDGLLPPVLSLVVLQHDVGDFGQGGDVVTWDVGTLVIETSEPLRWTTGANHYVRLMQPTGELTTAIAVTQTAGGMILAVDPGFTPLFDDSDRERTRYVFGPAENMGALAKVRAIVPRSIREIEHRVVLEDNRVHTADNAWLPTGTEQDPPATGAGIAAGGDSLVYLVNRTLPPQTHAEGSSYTPVHTYRLYNDGRLSLEGQDTTETFYANQWLTPQTVTALVAGLYEARFTLLQQEFYPEFDTITGDTLDVWNPLGTSRSVVLTTSAPLTAVNVFSQLRIEIRDIATATVQDSADYDISDVMIVTF